MKRIVVAVGGLAVLVAVAGGALFGLPRALEAFYPLPENPVVFPHDLHATTLQLECQFCHRNVEDGAAATVPAVEQCMFCHKVAGATNPRAQVVRAAWEAGEPLEWVRQNRIPDHTHFVHEPHIRAGFECSTCHGDVGSMRQVEPARTLNMGDCLDCHKGNNALGKFAPTECATCHF